MYVQYVQFVLNICIQCRYVRVHSWDLMKNKCLFKTKEDNVGATDSTHWGHGKYVQACYMNYLRQDATWR
jgi:hypothetical protein